MCFQVKVWVGENLVHYYVLSRFLISRMLTVTKIPQMKVTSSSKPCHHRQLALTAHAWHLPIASSACYTREAYMIALLSKS